MHELEHPGLPRFELIEFDPLLDSADMGPKDWERIARAILERYEAFDGFVLLHGTDTMAYTASALSFLLDGLAKPVVLTGSQIPLIEPRSDARENLVTSLLLAAREELAEVCLYLNGLVLRGNRSTKVSASGFDAFASPNEPPLGTAGVTLELRRELLRPPQLGPLRVTRLADVSVAALRLFPGVRPELVRNLLAPPVAGLVLESYGSGNAPSRDEALLEAFAAATARGVVIVNCTQCLRGRVDMGGYVGGGRLREAGVISGSDMTAEAALTKLMWLLSLGLDTGEVERRVQRNLRGELTP
ncbi:MAG: type I asparaginase, partial [Deinococcales bacterium]